MAYNRNNYYKTASYIISIYNEAKQPDVPDTTIVRNVFPKHNIHITYRQWMNIKGLAIPKQQTIQLSMF